MNTKDRKKSSCIDIRTADVSPSHIAEISRMMEEVGAEQAFAEQRMAEMKSLATLIKPYKEKLDQLAELVTQYAKSQGYDADAEFTENSESFVLQVGKQGKERKVVDLALAMKFMGKRAFFAKATLGLGVADQYLTPEEKQQCIQVDRVARTVKLTRRQVKPPSSSCC